MSLLLPSTWLTIGSQGTGSTPGETAQLCVFEVGPAPGKALSFLGRLSISIIPIFGKHSTTRSKWPPALGASLELAFRSWATEVGSGPHRATCALVTRSGATTGDDLVAPSASTTACCFLVVPNLRRQSVYCDYILKHLTKRLQISIIWLNTQVKTVFQSN